MTWKAKFNFQLSKSLVFHGRYGNAKRLHLHQLALELSTISPNFKYVSYHKMSHIAYEKLNLCFQTLFRLSGQGISRTLSLEHDLEGASGL